MSKPTYQIAAWNQHFENAESRKLKRVSFVCVPNKHDGKSYRRVCKLRDGLLVYGAFQLMIQLASKMPVRGVLADHDGSLDAEDMADKTGMPAAAFKRALETLTDEKIGWLEVVSADEYPQNQGILPASPEISRHLPQSAGASGNLPASPEISRTAGEENEHSASQCEPGESPGKNETPGDSPGISHNLPPAGRFQEMPGPRGRARENRREGKSTEEPPAAPQGGQIALLANADGTARINALFGRQKKWVPEEEHCFTEAEVTREEMSLVERWFRKGRTDAKYSLPESVLTLLRAWPHQLDRARSYLGAAAVPGQKKNARPEPDGWREWAQKKFGSGGHLPATFYELSEDVQKEFHEDRQPEASAA